MAEPDLTTPARAVYDALATGDRDALVRLLTPDFDGYFSPGLPAPIGGHHRGAAECIDQGWWAIGARWRVRAHPESWLPCGERELLVTGTYRGAARGGGRSFEAPFAHLWTLRGQRLCALRQYTDTALWCQTLEESR
jgi:ketosteroid isomerase-like protein